MMDIQWFGWLTKPHMLMTGLDSLIMVAELVGIVMVGVVVAYFMGYK